MIHVESAHVDDVDELTRIAHAAKRHWGYPEAWIAMWSGDLTVTPAALAEDHFYKARVDDGACAGFYALSFDAEADTAELEHMWIDPPYIGRGIGRALMEHAAGVARRRGCRRILIASDPDARGFYERMGAVAIGERAAVPPPRMLPVLELQL